MLLIIWSFLAACLLLNVESLNNGLALTPPMGWMSWERFRCVTDCTLYPDECISETLYKTMADRMVADGYLAAGYQYLILDDCWMAKERDANSRLQADAERFPNGIKSLADYVHSKGLKLGIYEDYGTYTCGGYPGSIDHLQLDAQTFASWEVDYVKLDGCYADITTMDDGYAEFGRHLLATNRSIVYSCSWPVYQYEKGMDPNLTLIGEHCNLWRNYDDIDDSWNSVTHIVDWFTEKQETIAPAAGPGHWNDPDMVLSRCSSPSSAWSIHQVLAVRSHVTKQQSNIGKTTTTADNIVRLRNEKLIIGNYGLSLEQAKSQMAIWALMAAPLIMSNDLRTIRPEFRDILLNKDIIAIDQDKLGIQGQRVYIENNIEIWTRPVEPLVNGKTSFAVAVVSRREDGAPYSVKVPLSRIKVQGSPSYSFTELFSGSGPINVAANGTISFRVVPSGAKIFKATASTMEIANDDFDPSIRVSREHQHRKKQFREQSSKSGYSVIRGGN